MTEQVNHPSHYNRGEYEVWDVLDDWFPNDPLLWNVGKYVARLGSKDTPAVEVGKIKNYLDRWLAKRGVELLEQIEEDVHFEEEVNEKTLPRFWKCGELSYPILWTASDAEAHEGGFVIDRAGLWDDLDGVIEHPQDAPYIYVSNANTVLRHLGKAWHEYVTSNNL